MDLAELVDPKEKTRRIKELGCVIRFCSSKGHPYQQKVLDYNPVLDSTVVKCTNCKFVYEKRATEEERNSHYGTLRGDQGRKPRDRV